MREDAEAIARARDEARRRGAWRRAGIPPKHAAKCAALNELDDGTPWCAARDELVERLGSEFLIVLHGPRGGGKTQLAATLCYRLALGGEEGRYMKAAQIFSAIQAAFGTGVPAAQVIDDIAGDVRFQRDGTKGLLVIDEVHERAGTEFEDRTLRQIIDRRYDAGLDTLLVTNETEVQAAESLGPSIVDRVRECGEFIELTGPSRRLRLAQ